MAGIYIHIPYCKKKCNYCNFFISTCFKSKNDLINAEFKELELQKNYLKGEIINTIYFGGGTPSLLRTTDIENYLNVIYKNYKICKNPEITIECNPEDITLEKLISFKKLGINRLSIGIQTFNEKLLKLVNRTNTLLDINNCLKYIKNLEFYNYNLDFMFGIFGQNDNELQSDIEKIIKIKPPHISYYCLAIEDKTFFKYKIDNKLLKPHNDNVLAKQFKYIDNILTKNGYIHYEISNYCLPGYESKHNSGYWNDSKYIGIGPSAHSYNKISRQFNVENIYNYIKEINCNQIPAEIEILSNKDKINDYIFTHLRTNKGINLDYLKEKFNYDINNELILKLSTENFISLNKSNIKLTIQGMLISNYILREMFV